MPLKHLIIIAITLFISPILFAQSHMDSLLNQYERHWELSEGMYRVMLDGKMGVINKNGEVIIPSDFNQVWNLDDNGYFRVLKNGKVGVFHKSGKIIIPAEYDQVWSFNNGWAKVMRQGKLGYFNDQGLPIVPCEYQQIWSFEDGKARVLKNGKVGYIDESGNEIIPPAYQQIWTYEDGKARVLKDGKIGYIDENGIEIIAPVFTHIWNFEDGKAKALLDGKMVWIDEHGQILDIPIEQAVTADDKDSFSSNKEENVLIDETRVGILGQNIIISDSGDKTYVQIASKQKNYDSSSGYRQFRGHYTGFDIGFSNYLNANGTTDLTGDAQFMDLHDAKSNTYAFNFMQWSIGLQRRGNIGLVTGLGLEYTKYRLSGPYLLTKDDAGNTSYTETERDIKLNRLSTYYLNMPLLLEFQVPVNGRQPFYLAAGGIGGLRIGSYTKVKYNDNDGPEKEKKTGDFNLNNWRYGVMVRMGYKAINLFGTYYFSTLFEDGKGPELYPISVGVSFTIDGLDFNR